MKGYYKNEDATKEVMKDGWFHSGDLAVIHPNGYIQVKDRSKDIIISGGENISSVEIENIVTKHPAVSLAAVVARPDEKWQAGAKFFMTHLLDGDLASNNFSWQWIASTFAGKPYIFNLENVHKYCHQTLAIDPEQNREIDGSYEEISARLFPNL